MLEHATSASQSGLTTEIAAVIVGVAFLGIGLALIVGPTKSRKMGAVLGIFGAVVIVFSVLFVPLILPAGSVSPAPAPNNSAVNVLENSSVSLATGVTWNSVTNTLTVDVIYNSTSNYWAINNAVTTTNGKANYFVLPLKLIRTDSLNATYSFPVTLATISTLPSLGSSPTVYSFLGYKAASGTTPAQWQAYFDAGTAANLKPSGAAPTTVSNVLTTGVPIKAFSASNVGLHFSLGGGNSTSSPTAWAQAVQNYTAYPFTVSIGQGNPSIVTIDIIPIGWHT